MGNTGKIKWILTKYETWFDYFLALFMSGYKWETNETSSFKANQVLHQLIFDVVGKVTMGGHLYLPINKAKKKSNQVPYLVSIHLIFPLSYALFMSWINEALKLDWCKTCQMLIVDVISLCKGNFMPYIFYINTLKPYTQKHHKYIKYSIFHDPIKIYSLVTNNFLFIMLEECFSIAPTSFPKYINNIKTHIECFSCWSWPTAMRSKVFY